MRYSGRREKRSLKNRAPFALALRIPSRDFNSAGARRSAKTAPRYSAFRSKIFGRFFASANDLGVHFLVPRRFVVRINMQIPHIRVVSPLYSGRIYVEENTPQCPPPLIFFGPRFPSILFSLSFSSAFCSYLRRETHRCASRECRNKPIFT